LSDHDKRIGCLGLLECFEPDSGTSTPPPNGTPSR
jgi:hypothetical protein